MDSLTILALKKAESGGGGDITVESLSVSQNGEYTAPTGKAYSPVTVAVPQTTVTSLSVTENATYTATEGTAYSPVTVNVPTGGLEYETGTYTPTSDAASLSISFLSSHTSLPFYACIIDTADQSTQYSVISFSISSTYTWTGNTVNAAYGMTQQFFKTPTATSLGNQTITGTGDSDSTSLGYYLTASTLKPYSGASNRYFRSGRTYKWIAVWAPTT